MKRIKKVVLLMLVCSSMLLNAYPHRPFGCLKGKGVDEYSKSEYKNNSLSDLKVELQLYHDSSGEFLVFRADNYKEYDVCLGRCNTRNFASFVIKEPNGNTYFPVIGIPHGGTSIYSKGTTFYDYRSAFWSNSRSYGDYELQWFVYETYDCQGDPLWKSNKLILNFTKENDITVVADEIPDNWDEEKIANHLWGYLDLPKHIKLSPKVQEQFEKYKPKILELDAREKKRVEDKFVAEQEAATISLRESIKERLKDEKQRALLKEHFGITPENFRPEYMGLERSEVEKLENERLERERLEKEKYNKLFWQRFSIIAIITIFFILIILAIIILRRKKLCKISSNN